MFSVVLVPSSPMGNRINVSVNHSTISRHVSYPIIRSEHPTASQKPNEPYLSPVEVERK